MKEAQMTYRQILPMGRSLRLKAYKDFIDSRPHYVKKDKKNLYIEHHHICPKSLGGPDKDWNMIWLTAHDHWWAHYYLWKAYEGTKYEGLASSAMWIINNKKMPSNNLKSCELSSQDYDFLKKDLSKHLAKIQTKRIKSPEEKYACGSSFRGKKRAPRTLEWRQHHSELLKNRLGKNKGKIYVNKNNKNKMIFPEDLETFLLEGYTKGLYISEKAYEKICAGSRRADHSYCSDETRLKESLSQKAYQQRLRDVKEKLK
jgi:hypothetical protein